MKQRETTKQHQTTTYQFWFNFGYCSHDITFVANRFVSALPVLSCGLNVEAWYWSAMMVWELEKPRVMIESVTSTANDFSGPVEMLARKKMRKKLSLSLPFSKTCSVSLQPPQNASELHGRKWQMRPSQLPDYLRAACREMSPVPGKNAAENSLHALGPRPRLPVQICASGKDM